MYETKISHWGRLLVSRLILKIFAYFILSPDWVNCDLFWTPPHIRTHSSSSSFPLCMCASPLTDMRSEDRSCATRVCSVGRNIPIHQRLDIFPFSFSLVRTFSIWWLFVCLVATLHRRITLSASLSSSTFLNQCQLLLVYTFFEEEEERGVG